MTTDKIKARINPDTSNPWIMCRNQALDEAADIITNHTCEYRKETVTAGGMGTLSVIKTGCGERVDSIQGEHCTHCQGKIIEGSSDETF